MAQKHVKVLLKEIKPYSLRLSEAEKAIQQATAESMLDPEVVEEATGLLKSVANYHQQVINCIYWTKDANEFMNLHGVQKRLLSYLGEALKGVEEQEPDSILAQNYRAQISSTEKYFEVIEWFRRKLVLPQSKRRYKAWERRNMCFINEPFIPFVRLDQQLKTLEEFIKEEL